MAEYIERAALEKGLNIRLSALREQYGYYDHYTDGFDECVDRVENFPAADVAPVKHGKWIEKQLDNFRKYQVTCSNCGWVGIENYDSYNDPSDFNYCPNCGAKMDLEG